MGAWQTTIPPIFETLSQCGRMDEGVKSANQHLRSSQFHKLNSEERCT